MTDLNSLPRTLAERVTSGHPLTLGTFEAVEAVIREAIDKALQSSIAKLQALTESEMPSDRLIGIQTAIELLQEDSCRANGKT